MNEVPKGFERFDGGADFMELVGPIYARGERGERVLALRVEDRHRNAGGVAHGGLLTTLVDLRSVARSRPTPTTISRG